MEHQALSIRQVLQEVGSGQIRVPAFQRGFVWEMERVAYLMDSIYKKYPFGSLLFWRTKNQLRYDRDLGPFHLPDRDPDYPISYVLDGQQRLTSIFGTFQTDLEPIANTDWLSLYFDLDADEDAQESQFVPLSSSEVESGRHFPLSALFDTVRYRQETELLDDRRIARVDEMQERFKEASIPAQILKTEDRAVVAIVFERVNRLGMELDTLQLLSAWTWNEDFDLLNQFADLRERLEDFGFGGVGENTNLMLRCCAAVISKDPSPDSLIRLRGSDVRDQFPLVENGIAGAIDFLRKQLGVESLRNLPYPALLVPLSVFFAEPDGKEVSYSATTLQRLKRWFWRCCFTRRYSSQTRRTVLSDIQQMANLKEGKSSTLGEFDVDFSLAFFLNTVFRMGTASTQTFILLLAQEGPLSFVSGSKVDLQRVLQLYNRAEFHHVYPRAYLRDVGAEEESINCLANFCFISAAENKKLGSRPPSQYRQEMPSDAKSLEEVLSCAICPPSLFEDDYDQFLADRVELLVQRAREQMGLS